MKIVVIGGGWSGVAAAVAAKKAGAEVCLIEKTDLLLGCGNVGGIMRNNGRYTATEEMIALGAGELFEISDRIALHKNIRFPGHEHASLYPVNTIEAHIIFFPAPPDLPSNFMSILLGTVFLLRSCSAVLITNVFLYPML